MFELESPMTLDKAAVSSANLTSRFTDEDLFKIGETVWTGYTQDLSSRSQWERRTEAAQDLAMQIQKDKSFPWPGCSNVAFPLVTIATMQYHARAYSALVTGKDLVKCRVPFTDPSGQLKARADKVSLHMSYQCLEEDEGWEEDHDNLLINHSVIGCAFKKSRWDSGKSHPVGEFVMARDLVLDYWARSVEDCPRKTHAIPLFRNEVWEKVKRGIFKDILEEPWYNQTPPPRTTAASSEKDNRSGTRPGVPDDSTPFIFLEQHVSMDLDGDGYQEPVIITIEESSKTVVQIALRFERFSEDIERNVKGEIVKIYATEYFTRYLFLPSPDGGIYGLGFGILLGPLNESVNSLVNQLIDSGTMKNLGGGFLARGAKIRGGNITIAPLQWQRVDSGGDDLRKSIVPLPTTEPSAVLFQLLGFLVEYSNRIVGTTDPQVGENVGQNTPAETSRNMMQAGQKVYNAIFKRGWRGMKAEFKKRYKLNAVHLSDEPRRFGDKGMEISRADYLGDPGSIVPAADPNIISDEMQMMQADLLVQRAYGAPGYNYMEAEIRWLKSRKIDGIEVLYPGPIEIQKVGLPPLPNPKVQVEQIKQEAAKAKLELEKMMFGIESMETHKLNEAAIMKMQAEVEKILAEIQQGGEANRLEELQSTVEHMKAGIELRKSHNDLIMKHIEMLMKSAEVEAMKDKHQQELLHDEQEHRMDLAHKVEDHKQQLQLKRAEGGNGAAN